MTTDAANYAYNFQKEALIALLANYRPEVKGHHTPSVRSVKHITAYIGHRQRFRSKYGIVCVDDTLEQIGQATCFETSAVSDVLRFTDNVGITKTIRRGGGRNKLPTVRLLVTDGALPERLSDEQTGQTEELAGKQAEHAGQNDEPTGQLPRTPRVTKNIQEFTKDASPPSLLRAGGVATENIDSILAREPSPMPAEVREQVRQFRIGLDRRRQSGGNFVLG